MEREDQWLGDERRRITWGCDNDINGGVENDEVEQNNKNGKEEKI